MSPLEISVPQFGLVVITYRCFDVIKSYPQTGNLPEMGGSLVGYIREDNAWIIAHAMPSSNKNQAGRTWLKRDRKGAQEFVERAYGETGGRLNYVGEWHTHPEKNPSPSCKDYKMMTDILRNSSIEIGHLFGLILGDAGNLYFWLHTLDYRWGTEVKLPISDQTYVASRTELT